MFKFMKPKPVVLYAPVNGVQKMLETVNDPVFSSKMMGEGAAFEMEDNTIYAPCAGKISVLAETSHAVGITMEDGTEVLIHIGIDTVRLQGKGFHPLKTPGETVSLGMPLVTVDTFLQEDTSVDLTILMVVLDDKRSCEILSNQHVSAGKSEVIKIESK